MAEFLLALVILGLIVSVEECTSRRGYRRAEW
jgi:hypothetical protein